MKNLLTKQVINNLLLDIQNHSGISINSKLLKTYKEVLQHTDIFTQKFLEIFLEHEINMIMRFIHQSKNTNWKSYDW